jgi:hypothetical protein
MAWPFKCAHCGSRDVQVTVDEINCLNCGGLTDKDGHAVPISDQFTTEENQ